MESGDRKEVQLVVDHLLASSSLSLCRICHEEEESSSSCMESPCSCSGSLKFAHRACIQRWCDEKGSTLCEICLQNFEPGYTVPTKKALADVSVTIRDSLEVPRLNYESPNREAEAVPNEGADYAACSAAAERSASCCRSVAVTFTILLLLRHLLAVLSVGANQYPFTLVTVFMLRASGILLPFYLVMRLIKAIQHAQWQRQFYGMDDSDDSSSHIEEEDEELRDHIIQIPA